MPLYPCAAADSGGLQRAQRLPLAISLLRLRGFGLGAAYGALFGMPIGVLNSRLRSWTHTQRQQLEADKAAAAAQGEPGASATACTHYCCIRACLLHPHLCFTAHSQQLRQHSDGTVAVNWMLQRSCFGSWRQAEQRQLQLQWARTRQQQQQQRNWLSGMAAAAAVAAVVVETATGAAASVGLSMASEKLSAARKQCCEHACVGVKHWHTQDLEDEVGYLLLPQRHSLFPSTPG